MKPDWLRWVQELQAIAQTGITFSQDPFEKERFEAAQRIAVEILACHTDASAERIVGLLDGQTGYATPKVGVRGAVFQGRQILLVKERVDESRWTLPGGFIDLNESPAEAVVREVKEESGFDTLPVRLLHLYDPQKHVHPPKLFHIYHIYLECRIMGGAPSGSLETDGVAFFPEDRLPELSVARVTASQISKLFEYHRNPDLPAAFD